MCIARLARPPVTHPLQSSSRLSAGNVDLVLGGGSGGQVIDLSLSYCLCAVLLPSLYNNSLQALPLPHLEGASLRYFTD